MTARRSANAILSVTSLAVAGVLATTVGVALFLSEPMTYATLSRALIVGVGPAAGLAAVLLSWATSPSPSKPSVIGSALGFGFIASLVGLVDAWYVALDTEGDALAIAVFTIVTLALGIASAALLVGHTYIGLVASVPITLGAIVALATPVAVVVPLALVAVAARLLTYRRRTPTATAY
jgi:hypothetical protein